jgi:glycosyltransferase involved in cell wall biosynthesis
MNQTITDFEVIVVDDGSNDDGLLLVRCIHDQRIRTMHQDNAGVSAARNRGINLACGEFVAFLDADDEWEPDHLETMADLHRRFLECEVIATSYYMSRRPGRRRQAIIRGLPPGWEGELEHYFDTASRSEPPLHTSSVAARRAALLRVGGFPEGVISGEDLLTWAKLALRCRIAYSTRPKAVLWLAPSHVYEADPRTRRKTELADKVGDELRCLYLESRSLPQAKGFRRYLALWYRMRTNTLLTTGHRLLGFRSLLESARAYPFEPKLAAYLVFTLLPLRFMVAVFKRFASSARV